MLLKVEPIWRCVEHIKSKIRSPKSQIRIVLFSAPGKKYSQSDAKRLKKYKHVILICGRYEGVDARVAKYIADEEISVGEYVLTGGEIPAMIVVDSVARIIPGVLGNEDSFKGESFFKKGYLEYPQYTKPADFQGWKVPKVLLSGNHKEIEGWRKKHGKMIG